MISGDSAKMSVLSAFVQKWCHPDYPPAKVEIHEIAVLEHTFGLVVPDDYKVEICTVGLPSPTLALLSGICERDVDLHDLSELYTPDQISRETEDWREIGMPENLIAIGRDSGGGSFCFDINELKKTRVPSASVYYWDHDFDKVTCEATSFSSWISQFLDSWSDGLSFRDI